MAKRTNTKKKVSASRKRSSVQKSQANLGLKILTKWALIDKTVLLPALLIIAAGLWVFWPALRGDWLWDDDILITNNTELRSWSGFGHIWLATPATEYWPLSWTALWIEWHLWGNHPLGYHLVSLVLHLGSSFLIWRLFARLGLRGGWIGGLLFVIHPLVVESVAWISEIKNTLSLPLFLLSFDAWLDGESKQKNTGYLRSIFYYLAAMLTKTSTVMLPLVLLLYGWWKRGEITRQETRRVIPYGIIALGLGLLTIYCQSNSVTAGTIKMDGYFERLLGAAMAVCFYLGKFLWPMELLPIYPGWNFDPPSLIQVLPIPLLIALTIGLWTQRKSWGRHVLFGFGFFALNLLPVLGLMKMNYLSISLVADHLAYLPMIGLLGLVVAGVEQAEQRFIGNFRPVGEVVLASVLMLLAWKSHHYAEKFINQETLWTYELSRNPRAYLAHNNLGVVFMQRGQVPEAIEQYQQTLQLKPDYAEAYNNLGNALRRVGRVPEAIKSFQQALQIRPGFAEANYNWGNVLLGADRKEEAIEQYEQALRLKPDLAEAHNNLGIALARTGQIPEAIEHFQQALQFNPNYTDAQNNLEHVQLLLKASSAKK